MSPTTRKPKFHIRIPKNMWNSHTAPAPTVPKLKLKLNSTPSHHASSNREAVARPTNCKTKTGRFQYGRHDISYAGPCLRETCKSCWIWHGRVMRDEALPDQHVGAEEGSGGGIEGGGDGGECAQVEPISPPIDPSILDGTWRTLWTHDPGFQNPNTPLVSPTSHTPVLTPVDRCLTSVPVSSSPDYMHSRSYNIFIPTSLANTAVAGASAKTGWRDEPRRRLTVRLPVGGERLGAVIKERERREKARAYGRARRAKKKEEGERR
jgi:hypothetical protein